MSGLDTRAFQTIPKHPRLRRPLCVKNRARASRDMPEGYRCFYEVHIVPADGGLYRDMEPRHGAELHHSPEESKEHTFAINP